MNGISVLLIERDMGGVSTRRMDCQGVWSSGTTYVTFEDVKVPVENLIGKENKGFKGLFTFPLPHYPLILTPNPRFFPISNGITC